MLTFLVAFTSSDITVLQHLSKVRVKSHSKTIKTGQVISVWLEEVKRCACHKIFLKFGTWNSRNGTSCCNCLSQWVYWTNLLEIEFIFSAHQEIATK